MKDYFSVGEISTEFGISRQTISKKIKELGIDSRKITEQDKDLIYKQCLTTIKAKDNRKELEEKEKLIETDTIVDKNGSTLEQRLEIAKREFDNLNKSLIKYQIAIETYGEYLIDEKNSQPYPNPLMKVKVDLWKQHNALQKTIQDLEDKLKYSISSSLNDSAIDD